MRVLTVDATQAGDSIADILAAFSPMVAAVTSISPGDACTVATKLALRYAVQCWDVPHAGKAIFWKRSISHQGLYRSEFSARDGAGVGAPAGLLRVTFSWDGRPLNMLCAILGATPEDADWQVVQVARELEGTLGPTVLAIDPTVARTPEWPGYVNAWHAARWRTIEYSGSLDAGDATRAAFGVATSAAAGASANVGVWLEGGAVRMYCSQHLSVMRACHQPWLRPSKVGGTLVADLTSRSNGGEKDVDAEPAVEPIGRTGTYSG